MALLNGQLCRCILSGCRATCCLALEFYSIVIILYGALSNASLLSYNPVSV